jgi:uncharacterized protein (DUF1800 family)
MDEPQPPHQATLARADDDATSSRRLLIASGLAGALGLGAALVSAGSARADVPAPTGTPSATPAPTGTPSATPTSTAVAAKKAPRRRTVRGGPVDRDASMAMAYNTDSDDVPTGAQYKTYAAAAAASTPLASTIFDSSDHEAHLLRRATFGARPSDVANLKKLGIDKWLAEQLKPSSIKDTSGDAAWDAFPLAGTGPTTINKKTVEYSWDAMLATAQAALARQIFSSRQLYEIVVDIFSAHLHVAIPGEQWNTSPGYYKNVIRKYAFGKFSDMLQAAMKHPAMLDFLSNDLSNATDVNENLGRELMELHTITLAAGYTETDVRNSAYILSGRTMNWKTGAYLWDSSAHYVGPVTVLGFSSPNATAAGGEAVGDAYLSYLAKHRDTALNIARKIATRFVSDDPSDDLLDRLADVYLASDTSILAVVKAVFLSSDFWSAVGIRMRRPLEDAVGAARVLGIDRGTSAKNTVAGVTDIYWSLWNAGNNPLGWNPPNGYPDVAAAWLGAGSMIQRWNLHRGLVYGWSKGLTYIAPLKLVKITKNMTAGAWVDAVSIRLIGKLLTTDHRAAVLAGMGYADTDTLPTWNWTWSGAGEGISLILDSAYFQLR